MMMLRALRSQSTTMVKIIVKNNAEHQEVNYEATYHVQLKPYFAIQPSLQYITNPSMDKGIKDVTVLGLRTEITF
jgi:porin